MSIRVLIVEDESLIRWSLRQKFEQLGFDVIEAERGSEGSDLLAHKQFDLVMLDHKLPDVTGLDILRTFRQRDHDTPVIMMTAYSRIEDAVEAIKLGAFDYVPKPFQMDLLLRTVDKALETTRLRREVRELRRHMEHQYGFDRVIGDHSSMKQMMDVVKGVCMSSATTVFLRGDTGTGKDLLARVIHYNSERAPRPFMNITCTAISEALLESELFGHERGAFTDARTQKKGLFELADGGTVFLDEVGDMPGALQAKLLRFLEERTFRRVGGTEEIHVNVRIIAATNRDIEAAIQEGAFRSDLLFRLNVVTIDIPALHQRGEDPAALARIFVHQFATEFRKDITSVSDAAIGKILNYGWPGNVRELRNVCERAVLLCKSNVIEEEDIVLGNMGVPQPADVGNMPIPAEGLDFDQLEKGLLEQAMAQSGGNQTKAAKLLNMSRDTFRYRLEKFDLIPKRRGD